MRQLDVIPEQPETSSPEELAVTVKGWLFPTIQGEGQLVGTPSLFLRLFGCNLACEACDTTYSWKNESENRTLVHVEAVLSRLSAQLHSSGVTHLVLTGGEPTLQADALCLILSGVSPSVHVTLETNGMIFHQALAEYVSLVSLSPKLAVCRESEIPPAVFEWLGWAARFGRQAQVKLVVESEEEIGEAVELLQTLMRAGWLEKEGAILQPEWGTFRTNVKPFLAAAIKHGLTVIPQFHKVMGIP